MVLKIGLHALKQEVIDRIFVIPETTCLFSPNTENVDNIGNNNLFIGYQAGKSNTVGTSNFFIGYQSGYANITGSNNLFIGYLSGKQNTYGYYNVCIGEYSGYNMISGTYNIFIGSSSGRGIQNGSNNVFIGRNCGYSANPSINYNISIGTAAGFNLASNYNTLIGGLVGQNLTIGQHNTCIGYAAGNVLISGSYNVFIGFQCDSSLTAINYSMALGYAVKAQESNTCYIGGTGTNSVNVLIGTYTNGMTAGGSLAIAKDLAHRGTKVGFYNSTPIVQQVLATGAGNDAEDIITFLQLIGLCKQS